MKPSYYIKKGFWISLGISSGIIVVCFGIGTINFVLSNIKNPMWAPRVFWETLWYNKEQKLFYDCWIKQAKVDVYKSALTLSKSPTTICKEKGLRPFPPYDEL